MNTVVVRDGASTYTRVSKRIARKMFAENKPFYVIAHKMRPGFPFSLGMMIDPQRQKEENYQFDRTVNNFEWYNANCNETGLYAAFYEVK